ncbi:MAG: glycosyltransferase family 4 protein [Rhodospirillales bacterium]|nr:glycosyltransferase family 4 protein [Rhodospirillales bacterium]
MIILFIHQNFPAQYRHLARYFADRGDNTVYFITQPNDNHMRGVTKITYKPDHGTPQASHPLSADFDATIRTGAAVAEVCRTLKMRGVRPDIIVGHNGWGETLFVKDVFADTPLLSYFEFFYHPNGIDVGFDAEFASIFDDPSRLRAKNAINFMGLDAAEWGHTATRWQRSLYPPELRGRITAIHEGVDTDAIRPNPSAWLKLARSGQVLTPRDEVITYVSRNLEPYRGFHIFMRALPTILRRRPRAHVIIVGGDKVSYGYPAPPGTTYREMMLREVGSGLDLDRVHFLGQIPYETYTNVLQVSSVHVYLTYPFILSWSFIEAMACGCLVLGSATPPVLEVLEDRVNGLAVDFFAPATLADRVDEVLDHPDRMQQIRERARETAVRDFDLKRRQLPRWQSLFLDIVNERRPALVA